MTTVIIETVAWIAVVLLSMILGYRAGFASATDVYKPKLEELAKRLAGDKQLLKWAGEDYANSGVGKGGSEEVR